MQDEINEKTVALYIKTGKLTAEVLQKAIKKLLSQAKKELDRQAIPHGKQTLAHRLNPWANPNGGGDAYGKWTLGESPAVRCVGRCRAHIDDCHGPESVLTARMAPSGQLSLT